MNRLIFKCINMLCNNNVITSFLCQKNHVLRGMVKSGNNNVITDGFFCLKSNMYNEYIKCFQNCNNNVITILVRCMYSVITFFVLSVSVSAKAALHNQISFDVFSPITQGSLVYGKTEVGAHVFYQNKPITLTPSGEFVFALPKDAPKEIELIVIQNNQKTSKIYNVLSRSWKEEVVNGLPPKKVSPSEADLKRVASENKLLREAREDSNSLFFPSCFIRPVDEKARISSEFGSSRVLNGVKTAGHSGTDYALPTGSPIYAPADGEVKVVHNDMFYSGKTILIDHGYGVFSSYSHLSEILVKQGEKINQGHLIGKIGTTGRSTGPHLHLTITWFGVRVDPEYVLKTYVCQN